MGTMTKPIGMFARDQWCNVLWDWNTVLNLQVFLFEQLPSGGKIFVIDEDDGFFQIFPECDAFRKVVSIWKRTCDAFGTSRFVGRKVPFLLNEAGFETRKTRVLLHTNFDVGHQLLNFMLATARLCRASCPHIIKQSEIDEIKNGLKAYLTQFKKNWFAVYPEVMVMAIKP